MIKVRKPGWFIKRKFLKFIFNDNNSGRFDGITKTSWNSSSFVQDDLIVLFNKYLHHIIKDRIDRFTLNRIWYQLYGKNSNSFHGYHTHDAVDCQISGIYYLRLRDFERTTQFLIEGKTVVPEVGEGDIILFDSSIPHRSPPHQSKHDKIVVSFNLDTR